MDCGNPNMMDVESEFLNQAISRKIKKKKLVNGTQDTLKTHFRKPK